MSKPPHHQRIPRPEGNIGIGIQETRVGSTNPANSVATTVSTTSTVSSTNTNSKMEYIGVYKIGPEIEKGHLPQFINVSILPIIKPWL